MCNSNLFCAIVICSLLRELRGEVMEPCFMYCHKLEIVDDIFDELFRYKLFWTSPEFIILGVHMAYKKLRNTYIYDFLLPGQHASAFVGQWYQSEGVGFNSQTSYWIKSNH